MNGPDPLRYALEEFTPDELAIHLSEQVGHTYATRDGEILVPPGEVGTMVFDPATDEVPESIREPKLCQDLRAIKGVESVSLSSYSIALRKGVVFEWDEILPQALMHISMHLNPAGEMIEVEGVDATGDDSGAADADNSKGGKRTNPLRRLLIKLRAMLHA